MDDEWADLPEAVDDDGDLPEAVDSPSDELPEAIATPEEGPQQEPHWTEHLLAGADGALFGRGKQLSGAGEALGGWLADKFVGAAPTGTTKVGGGPSQHVADTAGTQAARAAGGLAMTVPAAVYAGPSLAAQGLLGANVGMLQESADSEDPWDILAGAGKGAALGVAGAGLGKGLSALGGAAMRGGIPSTGTRAGQLAEKLWEYVPGKSLVPDALRSAATGATESVLGGLAKTAPAVSRIGGAASGAMRTSPTREVAYATPATNAWAIQSVLSSDDPGLDGDDLARLTQAVVSGDEDRLIAASFQAQQKSPAFARRMQEELTSLQRENR